MPTRLVVEAARAWSCSRTLDEVQDGPERRAQIVSDRAQDVLVLGARGRSDLHGAGGRLGHGGAGGTPPLPQGRTHEQAAGAETCRHEARLSPGSEQSAREGGPEEGARHRSDCQFGSLPVDFVPRALVDSTISAPVRSRRPRGTPPRIPSSGETTPRSIRAMGDASPAGTWSWHDSWTEPRPWTSSSAPASPRSRAADGSPPTTARPFSPTAKPSLRPSPPPRRARGTGCGSTGAPSDPSTRSAGATARGASSRASGSRRCGSASRSRGGIEFRPPRHPRLVAGLLPVV